MSTIKATTWIQTSINEVQDILNDSAYYPQLKLHEQTERRLKNLLKQLKELKAML